MTSLQTLLKTVVEWARDYPRRKKLGAMFKEVDKSNRRMSNMTREERDKLREEGLKLIYPKGYKSCSHNGLAYAFDTKCPMCEVGMQKDI